MEDFKKIANYMIGDSVDYDKPLDIGTAYKLLRQMVKKPSAANYSVEMRLDK